MHKLIFINIIFFTYALPVFSQITKGLDEDSKPLWELGGGVVSAITPAYPSSEDNNHFVIPFPTFFYRGEIFRADEEGGARGRFFKSEDFEINLSLGGSLPASSDDVKAREGMPDLNTMIELGPGLLATLWEKKATQSFKLGLNIPLRTAFAVDFFEVKERGLVFNPLVYFITENLFDSRLLTFTGLSTVVGSHKFNRYFYQVDAQFATLSRPLYGAKSGYLGSTISQGFSKLIFKNTNAFLGLSYSNYSGSANEKSPLFKQKDNFTAAIGFVWWFYESIQRTHDF